jgi:hypothetical protein
MFVPPCRAIIVKPGSDCRGKFIGVVHRGLPPHSGNPFLKPYPFHVDDNFRFTRNTGRTHGGLLQTRYCLKPLEIS